MKDINHETVLTTWVVVQGVMQYLSVTTSPPPIHIALNKSRDAIGMDSATLG